MADRHIVIIGGGFTGTALAIHLARQGGAGLHVTVIEPREQLAAGVAYGTRDPAHRINVPASRMQLSAAEEGDFDRWFRAAPGFTTDPAAQWKDGKVYPQRGQFAAYIREQYRRAGEGVIQADPLALGILVNPQSQVINVEGIANSHLYVAGPPTLDDLLIHGIPTDLIIPDKNNCQAG